MKKTISCFLIAFLTVTFISLHSSVFCSEPEAYSAKTYPSLLLITLDTTRADHLGCYGASFAATPNIDALARTGARFDQTLSPVPLTLPSHTSMLTGLVPRRHGMRDNALFRLHKSVPVVTEKLRQAGFQTAAFISAAILDREVGLNRGFDVYNDSVRVGDRSTFNYEERAADQVTDAALAYVNNLKSPFFLWVHYFDPHLSYVPPEPYRSRFKDKPYDGEIAFMDHEIGRLMEALRKKAGPLLVVVAGDHGESLGEHGEPAHDVFLYRATQRVPLIMNGPRIQAGKVIRRNVGLIDIAPTVLELLGLPALNGIDGQSLVSLLNGTETPSPDYEMESLYPQFAYGWAPLRALVRNNVKYIQAPRPELYDLTPDPGEKNNLIASRKEIARDLAGTLEKLTSNDVIKLESTDPALLELQKRIESLGYIGGRKSTGKKGTMDPKDGILLINDLDTARRELQLGNPKKGIPLLEKLLEKNPENLPTHYTLVRCYLAAGNIDRAITTARQAVALTPDDGLSHFNLARALAEKGRTNPDARIEAHSELERALSINPRRAEVYLSYANLLVMEKKPMDAYKILERAHKAGVEDPDIEIMLGLMEMANGLAGPAKDSLEHALALNPRAAQALEGLGRIALSEGNFQLAADYYTRALESSPSAELAKALGSIRLYKLNDVNGARQAFRKALELSPPDHPDVKELKAILESLQKKAY